MTAPSTSPPEEGDRAGEEGRRALSVCVLACNEETLLPDCLDSVAWADELVVVVDAKSRDASEQVARERAQRVEVRPYQGDIEQKSHCVSLASHDWVFILDPDEVVSPALSAELQAALRGAPEGVAGFELNRVIHHLGRWVRHGDFHPDWKLRLFQRSRARWVGCNPHGRVEVDGPVGRLRGALVHRSYRDLADQVERIQFFSTEAAEAMYAQGRRARLHHICLRPPARFLRAYLLKRGFLDGVPGFIIAASSAFYVLLKYAKLWERQRSIGANSGAPAAGGRRGGLTRPGR